MQSPCFSMQFHKRGVQFCIEIEKNEFALKMEFIFQFALKLLVISEIALKNYTLYNIPKYPNQKLH